MFPGKVKLLLQAQINSIVTDEIPLWALPKWIKSKSDSY